MRSYLIVSLVALSFGCHRPRDVRGLYLSQDGAGAFFPCEDSTTVLQVQDSTLSARYHALVGGSTEPAWAHLRGIQRDSGSVYGGKHYLEVREILELRLRAPGECPAVAQRSPSL
jgi:hypothetical protein